MHIPTSFSEFENLRRVNDFTQFYIAKPGRIPSQKSTFGSCKTGNTFDLFISISPLPNINCVSNLHTSKSISD